MQSSKNNINADKLTNGITQCCTATEWSKETMSGSPHTGEDDVFEPVG